MSYLIVRNLSDNEKTLGDLVRSSIGFEYWEDFRPISRAAARKMLSSKKIPPLSDVLVEISYTGKRGFGFVSPEGFETYSLDLIAFDPGWHSAGRFYMPTLVIINLDIDSVEFRAIFQTYKKIPYKVAPEAEKIDIQALSEDVIEFFGCELDLSYIDRFPNLKSLRYENMNDFYYFRVDLSPLAQCRTLEELTLDVGCGEPLDFEPLLGIDLRRLWYHDYRQEIKVDVRGSPAEVHEVICEYQREKFPSRQNGL